MSHLAPAQPSVAPLAPPAGQRLTILIADDHELIRSSLRELVEMHPGWTVCGEAASGEEALSQAVRLCPDVVILDQNMPVLSGLEAARLIRKAAPRVELLLFTGFATLELVREALACGVGAVALKTLPVEELLSAVEALGRHERCISKNLLRDLGLDHPPEAARPGRALRLTPREREVLRLLAEGKTNWCVASILSISVKTVETHRANLYQKLGLESATELVRYAIRNGVIAP